MFCSLISFVQRVSSLARKVLNSAGVEARISTPCGLKRSIISGSAAILAIAFCSLSTIALGVPAGTTMPCQNTASKSGNPAASTTVGMSGNAGERLRLEMAMALVRPVASTGLASRAAENIIWAWPEATSCPAWAPPL